MTTLFDLIYGSLFLLIGIQHRRQEITDRMSSFRSPLALEKVQEYDFIVVGAGSSGSVVANRLSENFTVLLIEAGGDPIPATYAPGNALLLNKAPEIAYQWTSVPQTYPELAKTGVKLNPDFERVFVTQGKALGGTSTVNAMIYNRGNERDYDNWAEITGDQAWSYYNLLEYFKRTENHEYVPVVKNDHLGYEGPLVLTSSSEAFDEVGHQFVQAWKQAGIDLGIGEFAESNGPQTQGMGPFTLNKINGRRFSTYDAFLKPILKRETLTISRYSEAKEIEIDDEGRAVGVFYKRHGVNQKARAKREIIISAGAFNSPKLLMLSGIGPKDELEANGIPVKFELPVGQRMQDHPMVRMTNFPISPDKLPYGNLSDSIFGDYSDNGKGPMAAFINHFAQGFFISDVQKSDEKTQNWPDIQFFAFYNSSRLLNGNDEMCVMTSLGLPTSYGTVTLNRTDPVNSPLIWDPKFFSTPRDVQTLRSALKIGAKIYGTEGFKKLGVEVNEKPDNWCKDKKWESEEYFDCIMNFVITGYHPTGSCPMGKESDEWAVLDSKLKVKGVSGLRVIDNSIQPMITNGNTNAPALVIGQRGAQFILEEHL